MAANMPQPHGKAKDIADKVLNRPKEKERKRKPKGRIIPVPPYYPS